MVDPWYSLEGHPTPVANNRSQAVFAKLRLRNVTIGHIRQALARISTPKVTAHKLPGKGLCCALVTEAPELDVEQIQQVLKEMRMHLREIIGRADSRSERAKRIKTAQEEARLARERGHLVPSYVNVPRYR